MSEAISTEYHFAIGRIAPLSLASASLETCQLIPNIHSVMPEPFDITNHVGNMWGGMAIASGMTLAYLAKEAIKNDHPLPLDQESMSRFRKFGVAAICGATALINCATETKWGVKHLPIAEALGGTTPDILDTVYGTMWAGLLSSVLFWRKQK